MSRGKYVPYEKLMGEFPDTKLYTIRYGDLYDKWRETVRPKASHILFQRMLGTTISREWTIVVPTRPKQLNMSGLDEHIGFTLEEDLNLLRLFYL